MLERLFPEGLKFVLLPFRLEWAESNTRLLLIKADRLDGDFEALGGLPLLKSLREVHKAYGEALGITEVPEGPPAVASLRESLQAFVEALRDYVVQVTASVRKKAPETAELAEVLLGPIIRWESAPRAQAAAPDSEPELPVVPPPDPGTPPASAEPPVMD